MHHLRCHVSGDVLTRTGYDLGPPTPASDLVFDEWVIWEDGISEEEAVAVGLWNNPAYQELLADLDITQADIIQAAQLQNPQVTTMFPISAKQWEFALLVPLDVLYLRPVRVSAAELESRRVAERLAQDGLNVVRDIRLAYIDWQLSIQRVQLAEQGAALRNEVARIAEARLAAGDVAELDVSAVRLDALVGTGEVSRTARDADLARERLRYILGIQLSDVSLISPSSPPTRRAAYAEDLDLPSLVNEAVSSRPDLRAVELAVFAAEERSELARRNIWQVAGILPDINSRGFKGFEAGPGLRFTVPLFHQNQGQIAQAEADAERLRRQYVNRRDLAAWEVRQAYIQFLQAQTDLKLWRDQILPQADQAVTSSRSALEEDRVSLLLVLETTRQLLNAQQRERESEAQLRRSIAELERSVGRPLTDTMANAPMHSEMLPIPQVDVREATR
ncbi:MAG: TolC family protein [Planctomycetes bacterium]|nr:TolC family protein [Planctomycetota bacterium]